MKKIELELLLMACIAAFILIITNFESVSKEVAVFESFKQTETYKSYLAIKSSESAFWSDIKGTKSNTGEVTNILNDAPVTEIPKVPIEPQKITAPVKFLLIGDSMMLVGFGPALENSLLKFNGVSVVREGVYSTGLNRIDYFDWFTKSDELIALHKPDVLIVMFGGNDGQGIKDKAGKAHELYSESWKEVYRERVRVYLSRVSPKLKKIYWVGHPITGNDNFFAKFQLMNPIYESESAKFPNAVFINSWERFAVNGTYSQTISDDNGLRQIAKQSDGVHVTDFGGKVLSDFVMKSVLKDVEIK